jgi:hypothetical protein
MTHFEHVARWDHPWASQADELRFAAARVWEAADAAERTLKDNFDLSPERTSCVIVGTNAYPIAMMLAGLCLENLIKGLRIRQTPSLVLADGLDKGLTHHRLNDLFKEATFPLSPAETAFVERVRHFVEWAGKYPFPRKLESTRTGLSMHDIDRETFASLADRLRAELVKE